MLLYIGVPLDFNDTWMCCDKEGAMDSGKNCMLY